MFLLVPAYLGSPKQRTIKQLCVGVYTAIRFMPVLANKIIFLNIMAEIIDSVLALHRAKRYDLKAH